MDVKSDAAAAAARAKDLTAAAAKAAALADPNDKELLRDGRMGGIALTDFRTGRLIWFFTTFDPSKGRLITLSLSVVDIRWACILCCGVNKS